MFPKVLSVNQLNTGVKGLHVALGESWIAVFYDVTNGVSIADVEAVCSENNASNTRVLTICSLMKSEGNLLTCCVMLSFIFVVNRRCSTWFIKGDRNSTHTSSL